MIHQYCTGSELFCNLEESFSKDQLQSTNRNYVSSPPSSSLVAESSFAANDSALPERKSYERSGYRPVPPPKPLNYTTNRPPIPPKPESKQLRRPEHLQVPPTLQEQSSADKNCDELNGLNSDGTKVRDVVARLNNLIAQGKIPLSAVLPSNLAEENDVEYSDATPILISATDQKFAHPRLSSSDYSISCSPTCSGKNELSAKNNVSSSREKLKANTFSGKKIPSELMEKLKNRVSFRFPDEREVSVGYGTENDATARCKGYGIGKAALSSGVDGKGDGAVCFRSLTSVGDEKFSGGAQCLSWGSTISDASSETSMSITSLQSEAAMYDTGDKAEDTRLRKLYYAAREILTVEIKYVEELHLIAVKYPAFLLANGIDLSSKNGENHVVNQIKSQLLMIKEPHKMLLEKFSKVMENWDSRRPNMAECLSNNSDMLKFCLPFLKEKKKLVDELSRALNEDAELASVTAVFQASTPSKISLIQRLDIVHQNIVRYAILMESYKKYLLPDSHEFKICEEAIKKLTTVSNLVNEQISVAEMEKRLLTLYRRLEGNFNVFEANRHLLHEGELMKQSRKKLQPRYLILFSDVLLICKYSRGPTLNSDVFQQRFYQYPILSIHVNAKERGEFETHFQLLSPKKSSVFVAKTKRECDDWVKRLSNAKEEAQKLLKKAAVCDENFNESIDTVASTSALVSGSEEPRIVTTADDSFSEITELATSKPVLRKNDDEYAPPWVPDPSSTTCMTAGCGTKFNLVNRRHHCRCCGSLICRSCTGYAPVKRGTVYVREKVCPKCFTDIVKKWAMVFDMNLFMIPPGGTFKRIRHSSTNGEEIVSGTVFVRNKKESEFTRWGRLKRHDNDVLILYIYPAEFDVNPVEQFVLMGFDVEEVDLEDNGTLFKLCHRNQVKGSSPITFSFRVAHPKDAEKFAFIHVLFLLDNLAII
uniref:FYVE-type domain-containing protein n=1 Tax=Syphacia muris TaxID=451379 RepID=A0A0N5ALE5_9BILA